MLVFGRRLNGETIITVPPSDKPTTITCMVTHIGREQVKLGWNAPQSVVINRAEVQRAIELEGVKR